MTNEEANEKVANLKKKIRKAILSVWRKELDALRKKHLKLKKKGD